METASVRREDCLFRTKSILQAINTLIKELGDDFEKNKLLTCGNCKSGFDSEACEDYHAYLKSVYDTLSTLKSALVYIE